MHNLTTMSEGDTGGTREYATRLIVVEKPEVLLPFVRAVLDTIGDGSAYVVNGAKTGILLTAPIGVSHFLDSVVSSDLKDLEEFDHSRLYSPSIGFSGTINGGELLRVIVELELIPPDMNCDWIQVTPDRSTLFISGPTDRSDHFTKAVLPSLDMLIQSMERPGFPAI